MSTLTAEEQKKISDWLEGRYICRGIGSLERSCSLAAINLALTGKLTDDIPECMSPVIGRWIIRVQDEMPDAMRNSQEWRTLLPYAAGTGREHEQERLDVLRAWMWDTVAPWAQAIADKAGKGDEWRSLCATRSTKEAGPLVNVFSTPGVETILSRAAYTIFHSGDDSGTEPEGRAEWIACAAESLCMNELSSGLVRDKAWEHFNPIAVLRRLIAVTEPNLP